MNAYPLSWPVGRPRTPAHERARAKFGRSESVKSTSSDTYYRQRRDITVDGALSRLKPEIERLGATDLVVSSNVETRKSDGLPRSNRRDPDDPGVAVYFRLNGEPRALSCDKWDRVADNIAAIAAHVDALRGTERWGCGTIAQAFAGFRALAAVEAPKPWWEVLGLAERPLSLGAAKLGYREMAAKHHPDRGGNPLRMAEVNAAYDAARAELAP